MHPLKGYSSACFADADADAAAFGKLRKRSNQPMHMNARRLFICCIGYSYMLYDRVYRFINKEGGGSKARRNNKCLGKNG